MWEFESAHEMRPEVSNSPCGTRTETSSETLCVLMIPSETPCEKKSVTPCELLCVLTSEHGNETSHAGRRTDGGDQKSADDDHGEA